MFQVRTRSQVIGLKKRRNVAIFSFKLFGDGDRNLVVINLTLVLNMLGTLGSPTRASVRKLELNAARSRLARSKPERSERSRSNRIKLARLGRLEHQEDQQDQKK